MKLKRKGEMLVSSGYRLPPELIEKIRESAVKNRRSANDEVIVLLEEAIKSMALREEILEKLRTNTDRIDVPDANSGVVDSAALGLK